MLLALVLFVSYGNTARAQLFTKVESTSGLAMTHNNGYKQGNSNTDDIMMNVGTGAAWFDYDNDGDLDLYITQRRDANGTLPNKLYQNNGGNPPTFTDVAASVGADDPNNHGCGVSVADYDNDGDRDIYLANCTEDVLLQNQLCDGVSCSGTATFVDVTATAFGTSAFLPQRGHSASWGDYDADGCLDLYVTNHMPIDPDAGTPGIVGSSQDFLFHNNCESGLAPSGLAPAVATTFTDVSAMLNLDADDDLGVWGTQVNDLDGWGFAALWTDIDEDGDLDLYLLNDCPFGLTDFGRTDDNKLWRNDGVPGVDDPANWPFVEISDALGPLTTTGKGDGGGTKPDCQNAMGIGVGDYDRDGDQDYFYTNLEADGVPDPGVQSATLVENQIPNVATATYSGEFVDMTSTAGLFQAIVPGSNPTEGRITWGSVFFDYDLDERPDLAVASGAIFDNKNQPNLLYHNDNGATFSDVSTGSGIEDAELGGTKTIVMGDYDADGDPDLLGIAFGEPVHLYRNDNANGNAWLIIDLEGLGPAAGGSNRDGIGARIRIRGEQDGSVQFVEVHSGTNLGGGDDIGAYVGLGTNTSANVRVQFIGGGDTGFITGIPVNQRIKISEASGLLPVEMTTFEAVRNEGDVVLRWATASETNNAGFVVERKVEGKYVSLGFVEGHGTTTEAQSYSYTVSGLEPGPHTFRVKQQDFDGQFVYSQEVEVFVDLPEDYMLSDVYPNPFNPQAQFSLAVQQDQRVRITVYDVLGRQVAQLYDGTMAAQNMQTFTVDGSRLSSGLYLVRVQGERFTATRQVTLLK